MPAGSTPRGSHNQIGDVHRAQGNLPAALESYRATLAIGERLAKADPGNADWQRDLACRIQDWRRTSGSGQPVGGAGELPRRTRHHEHWPGPTPAIRWQRDLTVSHIRIGVVLRAQGNLTAALESYRTSLAIIERLAKADPSNANGSTTSRCRITTSATCSGQGNLTAALESYRASLASPSVWPRPTPAMRAAARPDDVAGHNWRRA